MTKQKVIVLLSGGIDSTACVEFYKRQGFNVECLFINYGQLSANRESRASKRIANYFKVPYHRVLVKNPSKKFTGEILGRNFFLLSTALLNFKSDNGIICIGIHDGTSYPDCSKKFIKDVQQVFDTYKNGAIKVGAPFADFKKVEIWAYCKDHKVPVNLTYSCELGKQQPCGECLSCKDLKNLHAS